MIARLLSIGLLGAVAIGATPPERTFTGTISDSMCAMNHAAMRMGPTDGECTRACIEEHDAAYVLVDGGNVYQLSDQNAPKGFAGRKVTVVGTLDAATATITVTSISGA